MIQKMVRAMSIWPPASRAFGAWVAIFLMTILLGEVYLRNSTPAAVALNFTARSAAVQNAVGGAMHTRMNWIGHIHYEGDDGWASFAMQVTGPRATGTMDITLQRRRGRWNVAGGRLVTDAGQTVEIAEPADKTEQARAEN